jgi:phage-related protein
VKDIIQGFRDLKTWGDKNETTLTVLAIAVGTLTTAIIAYNAANAIRHAGGIVYLAQLAATAVGVGALTVAEAAHTVATTVATAATTAFGAAMAFLTSPITLVVAAIGAVIAIVVLLVKHWDDVKAAASKCWDWIENTWSKVASWFNTNVIAPVVDFFVGLWDSIVNIFRSVLDWVKENFVSIVLFIINPFAGVFSYLYNNFEGFRNFVNNILSAIGGFFVNIGTTIKNAFKSAVDGVKNAWSGIKSWFSNLLDGVKAVFSNIASGLGDIFKKPINWIIEGINTFISGLNKIKIPNWVPGVGGKGINISQLPYLQEGAVLEKGQTGFLEGNGAEAVVPLHNNKKWISAVAQDMAQSGIGGNAAGSQELLEAFLAFVAELPDVLADAFGGMSLDVNRREFARLVKAVN